MGGKDKEYKVTKAAMSKGIVATAREYNLPGSVVGDIVLQKLKNHRKSIKVQRDAIKLHLDAIKLHQDSTNLHQDAIRKRRDSIKLQLDSIKFHEKSIVTLDCLLWDYYGMDLLRKYVGNFLDRILTIKTIGIKAAADCWGWQELDVVFQLVDYIDSKETRMEKLRKTLNDKSINLESNDQDSQALNEKEEMDLRSKVIYQVRFDNINYVARLTAKYSIEYVATLLEAEESEVINCVIEYIKFVEHLEEMVPPGAYFKVMPDSI